MEKKRVALYLRLSKEDVDKITKEDISKSIKNQELLLREEVKNHPNWEIIGIFCDEDFSGAGTYRPNFEKMIKACENKEVDIVLCKSQSRFSRDMEVIEKYIHNKFLEWNIRFVSLIDNADTENSGNKKSRQINALVNEWFLEDLSDNIKATFRSKWKSGECTAPFAKYGFIKDPRNKNHLLVDPIAKRVLLKIANLFLNGYGQDKIADILEQQKIPSPYEYKLLNGCKLKLPILKQEDNMFMSTVGDYVVKFFLFNNYNCKLKNVTSIFKFNTYPEDFNIKLRKISEDIELYYPINSLDTINLNAINLIDSKKWKKLSTNEYIPNDTPYIISHILELDRLIETSFELEITLNKNSKSIKYNFSTESIASNYKEFFTFEYLLRKKYKWNGRVIYNMLKDETYNGSLVQGKTKRISYKNHKCIKTQKENWIIVKNAIDKIYDDSLWNQIQNKMMQSQKACANGKKHIFCGKLYCNVCGNILCKNTTIISKKNKKVEYFLCKDKINKWKNCYNKHSIKLETLENCILKEFNFLLNQFYDINILKLLFDSRSNHYNFNQDISPLHKEIDDLKSLINKKKKNFIQLYEDKNNNIIDLENFNFLRNKYNQDIENLQERLSIVQDELYNLTAKENDMSKNMEHIFNNYRHITQLTEILIDEFIKEIRVDKLKENKTRDITISWNF